MAREHHHDHDHTHGHEHDHDHGDHANTPEAVKERLKGAIAVEVADVGVLRKSLAIRVPRQEVQVELDAQYGELLNDAIVPGFRKGRAPRRLVEKRYGGEVGAQVQTRLMSNAYLAAVEKEDLKVLGDPLVWISEKDKKAESGAVQKLVDMPTALEQIKLPTEGDFEFKCEVELKPQFELPNLDGIAVEKPKLEITDEDVQTQIDRMRAIRGNFTPVAEGGKIEEDDLLICDMKMTVDGAEIKTAENINVAARAQRLETVAFEDFGKAVIGKKVGDTVEVTGELPDDYEREDLRGKQATFNLKINDIKRLVLPPLDKDFLATQGFDDETEYRAFVREQMTGELENEVRRGMRNQVRKYLLDNTKLDLPEGLSSRQTDRAIIRRIVDLRQRGVPMEEIDKHADELKTSAREQTLTELKLYFILEQIAEKNEVEVSEEDLNERIAAIARAYNHRFDRVRDELAQNGGLDSLYLQIRDDKCIDALIEKATVTESVVDRKTKPKKASAAVLDEADDEGGEPAAESPAKKKASRKKKAE